MTAAAAHRPVVSDRWIAATTVMLIAAMATLVRSFLAVKLVFVALFLVAAVLNIAFRRTPLVVYLRIVRFYLWIGLAGVVWAIVGLQHPVNFADGASDALRLYVMWSAAFCVMFTLFRAGPSLRPMHWAMVLAGILIPLINLVGLYDMFAGWGLLSESVRQDLVLEIGVGDNGAVQLGSLNISTMFVVTPYLLSLQFRADAGRANSPLTRVALVLSLIVTVLSGRRALWIVVALTPSIILLLSLVTRSHGLMRATGRRLLVAFSLAGVVGLGSLAVMPGTGGDVESISRLRQAFSSADERTIQAPYLLEGFMNAPVLGSGFGGYAGYQRNEFKPWTYELTYHLLLFNLGLVGSALLVGVFAAYFVMVVRLLRRFPAGSAIPFGLIVALISLLIGAYSNPYFGGFDSLFFVGLLPYLSSFQRGFDPGAVPPGVAI